MERCAQKEYYQIDGRRRLEGEYTICGAKNAALPIMAAALCKSGIHEIYGCPRINDVYSMADILSSLGAKVMWQEDCLIIDSTNVCECEVPANLMERLRSSVFLLGSLLSRMGEAVIYRPGGCQIGARPIDIHISGLRQIGFQVEEDGEKVICKGCCKGGLVRLPYPSVGATENLIMASLSGDGITVLENCAAEPEIADLQGFLRCCGFKVYGCGTPRVVVEGGKGENDAMYFLMGDRIEATTYMMALAGTWGDGILRGAEPEHMEAVIDVLKAMGTNIKICEDRIWVRGPRRLHSPGLVVTEPYPGFPTDCQPQLMSLAAGAEGECRIREEIFENRFTHKKDLVKMGANIETCGKNAIIKGVPILHGAQVKALDLRGGAALVIAGLMAEGRTQILGTEHIERGYADLCGAIQMLGGYIEKKETR